MGGLDLVSDFCQVYSANLRDLGSPSHSRRFFQAAVESFADEARIHLVKLGRRAIGAGLTLPSPQAFRTRCGRKPCGNWHCGRAGLSA